MDLLNQRAKWRTLLILGLMFAIFIQLGYLVILATGAQAGIQVIAVVAVIALIIDVYSFYNCDKVVLQVTGAQIVSSDEAPLLHQIIEGICIASGLPKPRIAIVQDQAPNAFATGRDPNNSVVAVTTGLLEVLDRDEIEGVLAHEMAHIYNRDIFVSSVAAICVRVTSAIANGLIFAGIALLTAPSTARTKKEQESENQSRMFGLMLAFVGGILAITFVPALIILQFAISRTRESMADLTGVKFTKNPEALARGLAKITNTPIPSQIRAGGMSHMWISRPVYAGGRLGNWVSSLTSSHPDPEERIRTLEAVSNGQSVDLAMSNKSQNVGSFVLLGGVALALVCVPAYYLGTIPKDYYNSSDYGTDGAYDGNGSNDDGSYSEPSDVDGGIGDGDQGTTDNSDGGIGTGDTADSSEGGIGSGDSTNDGNGTADQGTSDSTEGGIGNG